MPMPPIDLVGSPLHHPFGLSSASSFGSPFGTLGGHAPTSTPWNSSPPSSLASPFAYRPAAASRAHPQGAVAAAAPTTSTAAASPFNSYSGPSFEGLFSLHDDDLFQLPSSPLPGDYAPQPRGSGGGTTSRTRHFEYHTNAGDPYATGWRNLDRHRRGTAPSRRTSNNRSPAPAAAAGRSRETALEIHDSDDEVVEVIDLVS